MRLLRATIGLKVNPAKVDVNGWVGVSLVVCWHGRVVRSTGVKVLLKYWDSKRESVKPGHPNAIVINSSLKEMKRSLEERRDVLEERGEGYCAEDLWCVDEDCFEEEVDSSREKFSYLMGLYLGDSGLRGSTCRSYEYAAGVFYKYFGGDIRCQGLKVSQMKSFARWMKGRGMCDGSIQTVLSKVYCVLSYGEEKGIIFDVPHFAYRREYHASRRMYCLGEDVVRRVFSYMDGECMDYTRLDGVSGALGCFCSMWLLNGIAPIDYSFLRRENVREVEVDGVQYWKVEYNRQKTGKAVKALLRKDDALVVKFFGRYLEGCSGRDGYVFPMFSRKLIAGGGEKDLRLRVNQKFGMMKKWFIGWCDKEGISVDRSQFCYYTVRHTFASVYANRPGASLRKLATLLGRKVENLEVYLHVFTEDSDLVEAAGVVQF